MSPASALRAPSSGPRSPWRRVVPVGWLALVWVLLWGRLSPGNVLNGLAVGALVSWLLPLPTVVLGARPHPLGLARLAAYFLKDLAVSSVQVAWLALRPGPAPRAAVVAVDLRSRSDLLVTLTAQLLCLVPGSLVIGTSRSRLYVHVIGASDETAVEAFRRTVLLLEERVVAAFGSAPRHPKTTFSIHTPTRQERP